LFYDVRNGEYVSDRSNALYSILTRSDLVFLKRTPVGALAPPVICLGNQAGEHRGALRKSPLKRADSAVNELICTFSPLKNRYIPNPPFLLSLWFLSPEWPVFMHNSELIRLFNPFQTTF
jgi:hypothetical protein